VELAASVKNVIALAAGICDGLGLGDNTKGALLTRGMAEIVRLGEKMGAEEQTFFGLTGIGDLITTCISRHSRNRNMGELIASGLPLAEALKRSVMVAKESKLRAPPTRSRNGTTSICRLPPRFTRRSSRGNRRRMRCGI